MIESFHSPGIPAYQGDWRQMVDAVMIDSGYSGGVFRPHHVDAPERRALVSGRYHLPAVPGATLAVKIVDVLGNEALVTQQLP